MNETKVQPLTDGERAALITLLSVPGIGNQRAIDLVRLFGSPLKVLSAPPDQISAAIKGNASVGRAVVEAGKCSESTENILKRISAIGAKTVSLWDEDYPVRLKTIPDPPALLYTLGEHSPLNDYAVAVVGTRTPSDLGRRITPRLAGGLAASGVAIISGMAVGIDSLAHDGALTAGGRTIAVLGSGIDVIYPPTNKKLFERIVKQGVVMSEYPPGVEPDRFHFPQRNRIISGLSLGVVIVEAGLKSGALITARLGLEQGRELFAVPGAAGMSQSSGVNRLIKDGAAYMVESADEILEHLKSQLAPVLNISAALVLPDLNDKETTLYDLLEAGPKLIDELIRASGIGTLDVNRVLTSMQLKGIVQRLPGARVGRV